MYKLSFGTPERVTPLAFAERIAEEKTEPRNFDCGRVTCRISRRGVVIEFPMEDGEAVFGLGLQLKGFNHKGTKKFLRPNADPKSDSGDSHAPVPFFVSNKGYGIYVDSARYVTFYCGRTKQTARKPAAGNQVVTDTGALYGRGQEGEATVMTIEIPVAQGVELYIFEGDSICGTVAAYNRFSGGGCRPALWGLGIFYRCYAKLGQEQVLAMAEYFRNNGLPCDVLGLEPGWQSASYPCSFVWDKGRFPAPEKMLEQLKTLGFHVNLWEHAFVSGSSPLYQPIGRHCGDYEVWKGLVPDFAEREARNLFAEYHRTALVEKGVDGFKLDECDGSDFTGGWSFPDCSAFPSGVDGEQMHSLFGVLYQKTMLQALGNRRTFSEVRNAGALCAPYPFVLYSDLYEHKDFIRGLVNSGFSGILWTPELRGAGSKKDLLRRMQTLVFAPQMLINAWNIPRAPWLDHHALEEVRRLFRLRMALVPYLYSAFYAYRTEGKAPVRALACDYTEDRSTYELADEYLLGDSLLVAPMTETEEARKVYLPEGVWYDFYSGKKYSGGTYEIETEEIPVFVKHNTVLPLAKPVAHISRETVFEITLYCYGERGSCVLIEDDGETYDSEETVVTVEFDGNTIRRGKYPKQRYRMTGRRVIR